VATTGAWKGRRAERTVALTARGYREGVLRKNTFLPNKPNFPEYWTVWNRLMDKVLVAKVRQFVTWLCFAEWLRFVGPGRSSTLPAAVYGFVRLRF